MEDELFAAKYDNHDKNIDDCVTYILNWVQKSGCNGFCDDEIYGQAIHYYEEKDIEVGKPLNCQVSVNHHDTVDHINNMERFDNSIYNLRWADKGVQCGNRKDKPGKHRMVICIGDEEEIFFSCREAERLYNLPPNSVGKVCRGELESIYGYRFGYL